VKNNKKGDSAKRDNHKEIESCQNQKKDEEIKAVDYSQFEASTKSGIHAAVNGCYCLEVKELDGAKKELFEKIPCSCFFCYEG